MYVFIFLLIYVTTVPYATNVVPWYHVLLMHFIHLSHRKDVDQRFHF